MTTQQKTPVEVVQELIAVHTTRKEACQKLTANRTDEALARQVQEAAKQSDAAIAALMSELSQFGDAVGAEANRDNAYQELYKQSIDTLNAPDAAASAAVFQRLEDRLKTTYKEVIDTQTDLPQTLQELIQKQYGALG